MANEIEDRNVAPVSTSYDDYLPQQNAGGGSASAATARETYTGSATGDVISGGKQDEDPNLRNVPALSRPTTSIDGQSVSEFGAGAITDPSAIIGDRTMADNVPTITQLDTEQSLLDPTDPRYGLDPTQANIDVAPSAAAETIITSDSRTGDEGAYDVASAEDDIGEGLATAAEGELSDESVIDEAAQIDIGATARGETELGDAMDDYVSYDIGNVIDTSTVSGKLLADELGEGNYIDSKATIKGQLDILAKDFTDANGNPVIPTWAASNYRKITRMMSFKGLTGTAAMAAVQGALMESALDIAKGDSKFFETITLRNIDNKQESTINRANILSKLEIENLDNRQEALVQNSKSFLQLDLKNLDNEQQAEMINAEQRAQAIFDATNAENIQRKFQAQTEADLMKVYDALAVEVEKFNALQRSSHAEFVTNTELAVEKFNADLSNDREQFGIKNQILIDQTNAKWRQDVTLANKEMEFTAISTDIKNSLAISAESLNRLWDEADMIFDYLWKSTENELDRASSLSQTIISGEYGESASKRDAAARRSAGKSSMLGSIVGGVLGFISDINLKKNIKQIGTSEHGYNYYTWEWTDEALELGAGQYDTSGVIAQEVQKVFPEAVFLNRDLGYLMVNYSLLEAKAA
tara:strand:- start:2498 stop:4420 length:1923 start_codon:yes stop_codon:yes gene_type:complete